MKNRILCIWLPNWPVQRMLAADPQLVEQPLLLQARDPRRGLLVTAVNRLGRRHGIRPGMRLSEASALVEAEVREHDPQEDLDHLCLLAEEAQQFSPLVGIEQLDAQIWAGRSRLEPECLLLDVTGIVEFFGGQNQLLQQVAHWLQAQRLVGYMATANTVGAAWAFANYATRAPSFSQTIATENTSTTATIHPPQRVEDSALESANPPGACTEVEASRLSELPPCRQAIVHEESTGNDCLSNHPLEILPLAALRLPREVITSLRKLGLYRIGDLDKLPRSGMASRLGNQLLQRWDQAYGRIPEAVVNLHNRPDWQLEHRFEFPCENRETIEELIHRLCTDLAQRLQAHGTGVLRIVCRLDLMEHAPCMMQLSLFRPTNEAVHLSQLLNGQLEQLFHSPLASPVWRVSLQATLTGPMLWRQADLFEGEETENRRQLAQLVDSLSNRLGRRQVLGVRTVHESQPEAACSWIPLTGRRQDGKQQNTLRKLNSRLARRRGEPSSTDPLRRPIQLFSPPVAIEVESAIPTNSAAQVIERSIRRFRYQGTWRTVIEAWGPERLESGWWKGPSARREYFRIATQHGDWWWIYHDLRQQQWYLHGAFD